MIKYLIARWDSLLAQSITPLRKLGADEPSTEDKCEAASRCVWDLENEA